MKKESKNFVCILGNDGTGKSTMCNMVSQSGSYIGVERSMKESEDANVRALVSQIRTIDNLTYSYAFEADWYNFHPSRQVVIDEQQVRVFWVVLCAPVETLNKRISTRTQMTIYEHEKCINYFNQIYFELAHFYGFGIVNADQTKQCVLRDIISYVESKCNPIAIKNITLNQLASNSIQCKIQQKLSTQQIQKVFNEKVLKEIQLSQLNQFYFPALNQYLNEANKKGLVAIWIKNHAKKVLKENLIQFQIQISEENSQKIVIQLNNGYLFQKTVQGESKIVYKVVTNNKQMAKLYQNKVVILLKGTVYSHTNQRTAEITQLGKIRAKGSMIFLQMLKRNHIHHAYICVNREGIILSRFVETNSLQIVFKKQCLGTDKYSYFGMLNDQQICNKQGKYEGGIYVRFDWRNPNHQLNGSPKTVINLDPYYYFVEKAAGKQGFFKDFLNSSKCKPIGDKCVSEDLIKVKFQTEKIKQMVIQTYCTFQYYANEVGLTILDGCMMIDNTNKYIWSQINPDCLRVKSTKQRQDYDKDIWRAGGSSSKELVKAKWSLFNSIFEEYFVNHRFMNDQMKRQRLCKQIFSQKLIEEEKIRPGYQFFYQKLIRGNKPREIIATIDFINGEPILVESSVFKEKHSEGNVQKALQYVSILPQILLVDIDGASGKKQNNFEKLQQIASRNHFNTFAVGGGIRSLDTAAAYLQKFQHIVISSNLDLIDEIQFKNRNRIIVQLSINQNNQILTHSRTVNTKVNVIQKMVQLCEKGITKISITFNCFQGKLKGLPRDQLRNIMHQVPGPIQKVIIAGGISSLDDIKFVWGFNKCVPQLGSALWKNKVSISEIMNKIIRFDRNQLVSAIIQDTSKNNLGLIYLNKQAVRLTCETRLLHRFSRQHNRIMKKGQQSGNTQKVVSIKIDCDNDCLLITVDTGNPIFCHKDTNSCFSFSNKKQQMNLQQIQQHILKTKNGGGSGYTYKIQNSPKLAMSKIIEEADELFWAESKERKIQQCTDLLAHLLMYMNSQDIKIKQIMSTINGRVKKNKPKILREVSENIIRIGLGTGKHNKYLFQFLQKVMGVKIVPPSQQKQRNYTVQYKILDQNKLKQALGIQQLQKIIFVSVKPKDLVKLMQKNYMQFGVNYSNIVQNMCDNHIKLASEKLESLRVALIKRKGDKIDPSVWSQKNKGQIISEYPQDAVDYFTSKGIPSNYYSLVKVSGHSEGFLSDPIFNFCDAVVHTGKTIEDNNLEIQAILKSEINIILFKLV